jgi:hypothetical protein
MGDNRRQLDEWLESLRECKILSEPNVKTLCELVRLWIPLF